MSETGTPTDHDGAMMALFRTRLGSEVRDFLAELLPPWTTLGVYTKLVDDVVAMILARCKEHDHENS